MKSNCAVTLHLGKKAALKHTERTTADGQLARVFCASVKSRYLSIPADIFVYIRHSKRETGPELQGADTQSVNKAASAHCFECQSC